MNRMTRALPALGALLAIFALSPLHAGDETKHDVASNVASRVFVTFILFSSLVLVVLYSRL